MKTTLKTLSKDVAGKLILSSLSGLTNDTFFGFTINTAFKNNETEQIIPMIRDQVQDNEPMCRRVCGDKAIDLIKKYY